MQLNLDPKDTSGQGEKNEPITYGASYGETKESNSGTTNAIVWDNQGKEGFVKIKNSRQKGCQILGLEKINRQSVVFLWNKESLQW